MRKFYQFITQAWFLSLLGVLLLALIVWYVGPLIAIADYKPLASETVRLVTILVVLVLWGLNNLRHRGANQKAEQEVAQTLIKDAEQEASAANKVITPDEKILTKRLQDSIALLQGSRFGKEGKLYGLPWYMVIGAPGSGKTTALQNSGLHFPLRSQIGEEPIQGAGGTRYCDWWFTNEAILIDTAGRYTTQDNPKKIESQAWLGFLSRLKKVRPKRPLNGIIVTISIQDILQKTATQKTLQTTAIKQRIQELNNHLAMELPVYVVFTKLDMVAGFNSFFADMESEEREQVWGFTFPETKAEKTNNLLALFGEEYTLLMQRLNDRVLQRLSTEHSPQRRTLIYEFPRQMYALQHSLYEFLINIFTPNQFESPFLWRGTYFLSSTQSNMASQWVTGILPPDQCSPPVDIVTKEPKTYFVNRLLKNVIFAEANLASLNDRTKNRFRWIYISAIAVTTVGFAGVLFAWHNSKQLNTQYIASLESQAETYNEVTQGGLQKKHDWLTLANGLDTLKAMPTGYEQGTEEYPTAQGFGLYQGEKLGAQARLTYLKALEVFFMKDLSAMLTDQIIRASYDDELLYEALKFYLMLYYPEKMDREGFTVWVNILWKRNLPGSANDTLLEHLNEHLSVALNEQITPYPLDELHVEGAREILIKTPLDLRIYRRLKNDYLDAHPEEFTVEQVLGKKSEVLFYRPSGKSLEEGVPQLFTYAGFHSGFNLQNMKLSQRLADEQWIYGDALAEPLTEENIEKISARVNEYYFAEYTTRWTDFISDLAIQSFGTVNRGQSVVRLLASSEEPLVKLLTEIRKNTALSEAPMVSDSAKETANQLGEEFASSQKGRLERLVPKSVMAGGIKLPGEEVAENFEEINNYVNSSEGLPLHQLQLSLKSLNDYFQSLAYAGNVRQAAFNASVDAEGGGNAIVAVQRAIREAPPQLQQWFNSIARDTNQVTAAATQSHMNNVWQTDVISFFDQALKGRYPLAPDSPRDVKMADFAAFFGPAGILDRYFIQYVEPFADTTAKPWRWKKNIGLGAQSLSFFERAQRIKQAYFAGTENKPAVKFSLKPYALDHIASGFILETAGTSVGYNHGPVKNHQLTWPGENSDISKIVFNLASRGTPIRARTEGEWSWFRLLDKHATVTPKENSDSLLVTFELSGITAVHELKPMSVHNPYNNNDVQRFELPKRL